MYCFKDVAESTAADFLLKVEDLFGLVVLAVLTQKLHPFLNLLWGLVEEPPLFEVEVAI